MRNPNILLQRRRSSVNLNSADDNLLNRRRSSIGMAGEDVLQHFSSRRRSSVVTNGQPPAFSKPNSSKRGPRSPPLRRDSIGSFQICRGTCCSRLLNVSEELNVPIHAGFGRCCRRVSKQLENVISDEACARRFTIVTVSMFFFIFCVIGFSVYQRLPKLESGPWARLLQLTPIQLVLPTINQCFVFLETFARWKPWTNWRECKAMRILFYPTDQTIQKEKREWKWIWISLRHCFERDVHVVAGSLTCTCTPVVDVSFVQAAPWFPGLWVASDWQRPCGVLSDGAPAINRSRCVTNLSALSTNFGMCCFLRNMHYLGTLYIKVFLGDFVTARPLCRLYRALF